MEDFITKYGGITEEYKFYNDSVILRYDKENHEYLLVEDGKLISIPSVTTIVHIIDKSNALVPWAAKKVAEKFVELAPKYKRTYEAFSNETFDYLDLDDIPKLALEAKAAPREEKEEAADIGAQAHAWIEQHIKFCLQNSNHYTNIPWLLYPENEKVKSCCQAAFSWMQRHNVRWICTEKKIFSHKYRYAGTLDGKALVDSCDNPKCCPNAFKDRLSLIDWKSSNYLYLEFLLQTAAYEFADMEESGDLIEDRWVIRLGKENGEFEPWHLTNETFTSDWYAFQHALALYRSIQELENRINTKKQELKEEKKLEKQKEKEEQLKIKCKGADRYKGIRPPKCNGGNPCQTCLEKYAKSHSSQSQ